MKNSKLMLKKMLVGNTGGKSSQSKIAGNTSQRRDNPSPRRPSASGGMAGLALLSDMRSPAKPGDSSWKRSVTYNKEITRFYPEITSFDAEAPDNETVLSHTESSKREKSSKGLGLVKTNSQIY